MSYIKIAGWPKRPAEQRRDELEIENAELRKSLSDRESELDITMAEQEQLIDEIAELRKLVEQMRGALSILGRIWFYGDFKPETPNEKHLSVMMKEMGFKYESENEVLAVLDAAERGGK